MRVTGMEASNVQPRNSRPHDTKENNTNQVNSVAETKNISQIKEFEKREMSISEKTIIDAIERANRAIEGPNKRFEFAIHKKTHEIMVKVINNDTGEIIREFPPEKILDMVAKMWEMAGIMVDERR